MWTSVRDGDDARALRADHAQPFGAPCSVIAIPERGPVRNVLHARSHQFGFLPHFQSGLSWHDAAWAGARRAAHVARSSATLAAWRSCLVRPRLHRQRSGIVRGSLRSDKHRPVLKAHRPRTPPHSERARSSSSPSATECKRIRNRTVRRTKSRKKRAYAPATYVLTRARAPSSRGAGC